MCVPPTITQAGSSAHREPIDEGDEDCILGSHPLVKAWLLIRRLKKQHNSAKQIVLIAFAGFTMLHHFRFIFLIRCDLFLLDRAAPRHSSRYAEFRQYPEL